MPIHILDSADPLSDASLRADSDSLLRNLQSGASRVLRLELARYCRGEVNGRSFLIAGHRGAGKTTMVADALERVLRRSRLPDEQMLRPLPIFLHGPSLFETEANEPPAADKATKPRRDRSVPSEADKAAAESLKMAALARVALKHIILGIHRAVLREFSRGYREHLAAIGPTLSPAALRESTFAELAAQFEIELAEDPSAQRLHEFWEMADALHSGVLGVRRQDPGQGMRELVALNGLCNAHQRISGEMNALDKTARSDDELVERSAGVEARGTELVKVLAPVATGAAVAAGAAAGSHSLGLSLLSGLVAAAVSTLFVKSTRTTTQKRGRQTDTTFIPDLSLKTLDRILPTLVQRLRDAGLAPVLVIDELDKVRGLPERLVGMIHFLKKLLAENVFTCFLTDRAYLEHLRLKGNGAAYGPAYSYFTHPLLIAYLPGDFDGYLDQLLKADRAATSSPPSSAPADPAAPTSAASAPKSAAADGDKLDLEVLKWVLRHRAQLHALAMARQISSLRGENATVQIVSGVVRTEYTYRIDVTFQVAIELQLAQSHVQAWLRQRPDMSQTLFDALYYPSRQWLEGERQVVRVGTPDPFHAYLVERMNLGDLRLEGSGELEVTQALIEQTLTRDDRVFLNGVLDDMMRLLGPAGSAADITARWAQVGALAASVPGTYAEPGPSVFQCLLTGPASLLRDTPGGALAADWRYWPSGVERAADAVAPAPAPASTFVVPSTDPALLAATARHINAANEAAAQAAATAALMKDRESAYQAVDRIKAIEDNLWHELLRREDSKASPGGEVFELLADRARLLPTTPAWPRVRSAIANLEQMRSKPDGQGGNQGTLLEDVRAVEDFARMLDDCAPTIARTLVVSAFIGAARAVADWSEVTPIGVAALAAGLGFAARDVPGIDRELQVLRERIAAIGNPVFDVAWQNAGTLLLSDPKLRFCARSAHDAGTKFASPATPPRHAAAAWQSLESRLDAALEGRDVSAGLDELVCAVANVGPARRVGLDLKAMTLEAWTRAFLNAASVDKPPLEGDEIPLWLIGHSLNRLGGPGLQSQELEGLIRWAIGSREAPPWLDDRIHNTAARLAPNEPEPDQGQRIAICVATGDDPPMVWWTRPPRRGVAFVIDPKDLMMVLSGPARALNHTPIVAVAQGRGIRLSEREMREAMASYPVANLVWVYRSRISQMSEPWLVDPQSPDEVLDQPLPKPIRK